MREIRKKIILIGDIGVGKTSLIKRFVKQEFSDEYLSTIGVRVDKKTIQLEEEIVHLLIWDLAGEIMQNKAYESYIKGAAGIIGVFDITRPSSLKSVKAHMISIESKNPDIEVMLIGNKLDLAEEFNVDLSNISCDFLTSAKTGEKTNEALSQIAKTLIH